MNKAYNPLLNKFDTPEQTAPFSKINNSHYLPAIKAGIAKAYKEIDRIVDNTAKPTFENTIVALENSGSDLDRTLNVFYPLLSADSDEEMMQISLEASQLLSEYSTAIALNEKLWQRIRYVYDNKDKYNLDAEDSMLLQESYEGFARNGALLEGDDREEYRKLSARISELTTLFGQNVLKELNTYQIYLGEEDISGLPENLIEEASAAAKAKGRDEEYLFTLAQPTYMPFMKYSDKRELREKMWRLYTGRNINGEFSNIDILKEIAETRYRIAKLLGYPTAADYILERTMAKTPSRVYELLDRLRDAYRPAEVKEIDEITRFASELEGEQIELEPWDYSYYANKLKERKFAYSEEELRPYFKLENVIDGVFGLATRLYGLQFKERNDIDVYHPDVKVFEVDDADGSYLGILYTDFFPRDTKRPGAWMTEFKSEWKEPDGKSSRPHISIVMNFTKPTATKPSLLTPYEVSTFLHEFGHALHGLLADTRYKSLSGTNVRRDFVELPSQFNENFLNEKEFLDSFARHYETGEAIPQSLIDRMKSASQFGAAYACLRQLNFGYLDMAFHTVTGPIESVAEFEKAAGESVMIFSPEDNSLVAPQFSHIFAGGYAAGYYSYKWAEVLDADAFAKFKADGIFNRDTAMSFRHNILERGGTEEPDKLYRRFRGKEPSIDALLRRDGIN